MELIRHTSCNAMSGRTGNGEGLQAQRADLRAGDHIFDSMDDDMGKICGPAGDRLRDLGDSLKGDDPERRRDLLGSTVAR